ncbi:MAG TPA: nitrous oxide reductase accessory protein NosL [Gemmatimonadales bacterium]|nr:nitrous oxide reductase accessory protein NosL [Gemmatimonadales bacterium]
MKALVGILGFVLLVVVGVVFLWPVQRVGPEPIQYGRDTCDHCRMHLSRPGFAGEIRDRHGVLTKYDDLGCLLRSLLGKHEEIPEAWVEDHGTGALVPLIGATLVRAPDIETPMGSSIVAFSDERAAREFADARGGEVMQVEDVLRNPSRFVPVQGSKGRDVEVSS